MSYSACVLRVIFTLASDLLGSLPGVIQPPTQWPLPVPFMWLDRERPRPRGVIRRSIMLNEPGLHPELSAVEVHSSLFHEMTFSTMVVELQTSPWGSFTAPSSTSTQLFLNSMRRKQKRSRKRGIASRWSTPLSVSHNERVIIHPPTAAGA